jgi:ParB family transcriptional regulator, chromosome partitioning protein
MTTTAAEVAAPEAPPPSPGVVDPTVGATATLTYLDPRALAANPANVRSALGEIGPLVASVRSVGILEPLIVIPDGDGGHLIVAGHRRNAAAIEADQALVPCLVRPDLAAAHATAQVVAMLVENTQRVDLTPGDLARGYEQLRLGGLSANKIAKAVGQKPANVKTALAVAGSELASAAVDRYDLTLTQAAVIAEFESDDDAVKHLVVTAKRNPGNWDHSVSRLRQDRKNAATHAATIKALVDAGTTVIDHPTRGQGPVGLDNLLDGDGNVLDGPSHAACPGHAAAVSDYRPDEVTYYCLDPVAHGHQGRWAGAVVTPTVVGGKMTEEAKAARREIIEGNKAWRAAEPVRRQWIRDLLARKAPPKATLRFCVTEILAEPDRVGDGKDALLADLLHKPEPGYSYGRKVGAGAAADVTEARLPLLLLAQVAADREQTMSDATWRHANPGAARWFAFLASTGYTLAHIEQRVLDDGHNTGAEGDVNGDEYGDVDEGYEPGDDSASDRCDEMDEPEGFDPPA